jgi:hypothetical protein
MALADRAQTLRARLRPELHEHIERTLRGIWGCDRARARAEVEHFEEYLRWYATQVPKSAPGRVREPGDDDGDES